MGSKDKRMSNQEYDKLIKLDVDIWNEAIEAAAKCVDDEFSNISVNKAIAAREIRKLKK